jgi:hypothetical protein
MGLKMSKIGSSGFGGALALAAYATLFLGNCGGESLNGPGTGGQGSGLPTTGAGGSLDGTGGTRGTLGPLLGGSGGDGTPSGGTTGAGGDCQLIVEYPPVVTVVDGSNGHSICDPTFAIVDVNAANPIVIADVEACDGTSNLLCPGAPPDAGPGPCRFALTGVGDSSVGVLQVSAPAYLPSSAYDVTGGFEGCTSSLAASQITVPLFPVPADGGVDAN